MAPIVARAAIDDAVVVGDDDAIVARAPVMTSDADVQWIVADVPTTLSERNWSTAVATQLGSIEPPPCTTIRFTPDNVELVNEAVTPDCTDKVSTSAPPETDAGAAYR